MLSNPRNLKFSNSSNTSVDFMVDHIDFGAIPYTATADDINLAGRAIFNAALNNQLGPILPYAAPIKSQQQIAGEVRADKISTAKNSLSLDADLIAFKNKTLTEALADISTANTIPELKVLIKRAYFVSWYLLNKEI